MTRTLDNYKGRWHTMLDAMMDFLPSSDFMVFSIIYSTSKKTFIEGEFNCSQRILALRSGMSRKKVNQCLDHLQQLNLIQIVMMPKKVTAFRINWDEVDAIDNLRSQVSYDGIAAICNACFGTAITPCSKLPDKIKSQIVARYKYEYNQTGNNLEESAEMLPDAIQTGNISDKNDQKLPDTNNKHNSSGNNLEESAEMLPDEHNNVILTGNILTQIAQMLPVVANSASHTIEKDGDDYVINVLLSDGERYLFELAGEKRTKVVISSGNFSTHLATFRPSSGNISAKNGKKTSKMLPQINNNINNINHIGLRPIIIKGENENENEENDDTPVMLNDEEQDWNNFFSFLERSSKSIGNVFGNGQELPAHDKNVLGFSPTQQHSSRKGNKLVWNENRDLSLSCYTEKEIQAIMDNSQFYDSDEDKIIRMVWNDLAPVIDLDNKDEYETEQEGNNDILPVKEFNRELADVLEELREQDSDFQLTDKQAQDIFGFDVVELEDEFGYVLAPSKIRKLHNDNSEFQHPSVRSKKNNRRRGAQGRKEITTFLECIEELAKDESNLTSAEMFLHTISKYAESESWTSDTGFVHRPHEEVSGLLLPELVTEWSVQSGLSEENIMALLKKFPHRNGKTILHPQHLSVDDIVSMNELTNEDSEVERLYGERMKEG